MALIPHAIVLAAALAATVTGYGFVVLSAPLLSFVLPPGEVVPLTLALGWGLITGIVTRPVVWRAVAWRLALRFTLAGTLGIPIGTAILASFSPAGLRLTLGLVVTASALASLATLRGCTPPVISAPLARPRGRAGHAASYLAGFAGGVLSGCVGMNGPPVALYLALTQTPKDTFRATSAATVWLLSTLTLGQFALMGYLPANLAGGAALLVPSLVAGGLLGAWVFGRLSTRRFQVASLAVAATAGVVTAIAGVLQ